MKLIIRGSMGQVPDLRELYYLSVDPGVLSKDSTGITLWDRRGKLFHLNELNGPSLHQFLDWIEEGDITIRTIITEEFRLYQNKALQQAGSKLETVQIIGMLKRTVHKLNCEFVEVRADAKDIAAMWSQTKVPKGHMPNWMSAYLVGYYYLHEIGIIRAKVLDL